MKHLFFFICGNGTILEIIFLKAHILLDHSVYLCKQGPAGACTQANFVNLIDSEAT